MTRIGATPRHVLTPNRLVEVIDVEVTTHATAVLRFASGVVGTVIMSFDIWHKDLPYIEIDGTEGALRLSDPNGFDGPVRLRRNLDDEWQELEPVLPISATPGTPDQMLRGMGVADLVASIHGSPQRATPSLAFHVLEVLEAVETSSRERRLVRLKSTCERPAPVRPGDLPMAPLDAEEPTNLDGKEANNV
jgi:predicted dehydrogenase